MKMTNKIKVEMTPEQYKKVQDILLGASEKPFGGILYEWNECEYCGGTSNNYENSPKCEDGCLSKEIMNLFGVEDDQES